MSRTFLYDNPAARDLVTAAITRAGSQRRHDRPRRPDGSILAAAGAERRAGPQAAHAEIRAQRARIGELLGQLRDTQHDYDGDTVQRLATENATLNSASGT